MSESVADIRTLRRGQQRLFVHRGVEADPKPDTTTPSEVSTVEDEMGRLEQLVKDYERGDITKVDWLDRIAFRQIERAHAVSRNSVHLLTFRLRQRSPTNCTSTSISLDSTFQSSTLNRRVLYQHRPRLWPMSHKHISNTLQLCQRIS